MGNQQKKKWKYKLEFCKESNETSSVQKSIEDPPLPLEYLWQEKHREITEMILIGDIVMFHK